MTAVAAENASTPVCLVCETGRLEYETACRLQDELVARRHAGECDDILLLVEHPAVLTVGRGGGWDNVRAPMEALAAAGISVHETSRGGNITYHGPGQLVGYPILDLKQLRADLRWYLRELEQVLIDALDEFGIEAHRRPGLTGVWTRNPRSHRLHKIAAIGVAVRHWITLHGFALNIDPDLSHFELIHPCGLDSREVTSMAKLAVTPLVYSQVLQAVTRHFGRRFGRQMKPTTLAQLGMNIAYHEP